MECPSAVNRTRLQLWQNGRDMGLISPTLRAKPEKS